METSRVSLVDMRSDTVTKPTDEMRKAMFEAEVGDDVLEDDPTVILLEKKAAHILGKQSALFVPSGTMGNLICIMAHCSRRGDEVLLGDKCHISLNEQGGMASLGGVHPRTVKTMDDGTLDLVELQSKIMPPDNVHVPRSRVVCIENTHNLMGGKVVRPAYMKNLAEIAKVHGLKIHVDGARIFNAATALNLPAAKLVEDADSVSCCLSKGLGAPIGSVVVGSKDFIKIARRLRKALGGGMRQVGVIAAPGIIALEKMSQQLSVDHDNAKQLALGLANMQNLGIKIDPDNVETNIVYFSIFHPRVSSLQLVERLGEERDGVIVKMLVVKDNILRAVTHHQISKEGIEFCLQKIKFILETE